MTSAAPSTAPAPWFTAWVGTAGIAGLAAGLLGAGGLIAPPVAVVGALAALGGLLGGVAVASARPEMQVFGPALVRGRHPGRAALTLDDGPDPASTPAILAVLAELHVHATFFVLVDRVLRYPELLSAMVAGGHEIGLHGLTHDARLTVLSPEAGAANLREAIAVLRANDVPPVRWYRPPFGVTSPRLHAAVRGAGLELAWCSVRTLDGVAIGEDALRAHCRAVVGTDIVLLHEGPGPTTRLLDEIVAEWDARGIRASTVSEALEG